MMKHLEVCVDRIDQAVLAERAGATRIELNSGIGSNGLTPTHASCQWVVKHCRLPVLAMLRPHDDGFQYTSAEYEVMLSDCHRLLDTGLAGIVFGGLNSQRRIDVDFAKEVVGICGKREAVFHRAFDVVDDRQEALEALVSAGVQRVLTSGGAPTAFEGAAELKRLVEQAQKRIEILPGGGVRSGNARHLLEETGCGQLHGTFSVGESQAPDPSEVAAVARILDSF